ncbi:DEAD/DEAH box helicase [Halodesulfovibrio marinisediminis]|uniref:ATP-dependent RNA helicase DeaD n=1 Tax=Halodesulfovibrio marinisediminis DSM 17456 TaxID=1121457 RepID=A0A1N6F4I0_9BACT|nr:DEAD/DEAH box helicase [Halodesulfovibrio marinisediminis]SIN90170.1 ATP-dependent RNA helicase DeaD [Halodesulfovibrio marinisediminis DSM 17456]
MTDESRNSASNDAQKKEKQYVDPADRIAAEITGITEPEDALPPITLEDLPEKVREACFRAGWNKLMPVQAHAIPYELARRDIMVQSRTGSGKTGTYLLPALERVDTSKSYTQMLILVPTRELALQVEYEATTLFEGTGITSCAVYGGVGYGKQVEKLNNGAHVVIGTPGRVLDHLIRHTLDLSKTRILVFDEADRMLSIGFYPDMVEIKGYLPRKRSTFLLSATYPPRVIQLAGEFMHKPSMLSLSHQQVHVVDTPHVFYNAKPMDKDRVLVRVLEVENPSSAIIFCNTKANVHYVTAVLKGFGYDADELSADLSQSKREKVLTKLREGNVRFLVATDVAARGIDIPELSHVILYEPPEDRESYIHRAGRTGRAGASGEVISLVDIMQKLELERIGNYYKISLQERETPTDEDVAKIAGQRLTAMLEGRLRGKTGLEKERMKRFVPLLKELSQDDEQLLLAAQLLDELYQQTLHTPPPAPEVNKGRQQKGGEQKGQRKTQGQQRRHTRPRRRKPAQKRSEQS